MTLRYSFIIALVFWGFWALSAGFAFGQPPDRINGRLNGLNGFNGQGAPIGEGQAAPSPEAAPAGEQTGEEEIPEMAIIKVREGMLSVELENATFGKVMAEISNSAGFELYMSKDVYGKRVTTTFREVDVQRGIMRLLGLVRQKTYFVYYKPDGSIRKLEIFGITEVEKRKPQDTKSGRKKPTQKPPAVPGMAPVMPHGYTPGNGAPPQSAPTVPTYPAAPKPPAPPQPSSPANGNGNDPSYIPPRQSPVYIPPLPGR